MVPTNEGLEAADLVAAQINHRLIVKLELTSGEGVAHIAFKGAPGVHLRIHLWLKEAEGPSPVAFGTIER